MEADDSVDFQAYLNRRCEKTLLRLNGLTSLEIGDLEQKFAPEPANVGSQPNGSDVKTLKLALQFDHRQLGWLSAASDEPGHLQTATIQNELRQFAAEISCLIHLRKVALPRSFRSENRRWITKLDALVEEIALSQPAKFHWTGVYLLLAPETLTLGAFRREPSPHEVIPVDRGICGAAVREEKTLNIADVKSDDRYLSCSIKTKSEIVVPVFLTSSPEQKKVIGEIDIDSHIKNAFSPNDEALISSYSERIATILI